MTESCQKKVSQFTDEEASLLLKVTIDYRSQCIAKGPKDWEAPKNKYSDLLQRYVVAYPEDPDPISFPNGENPTAVFTKEKNQKNKTTLRLA